MAILRDIKHKIGAVKKTKQITRAMNMVAASKMRTVQGKMENFVPYAAKFSQVLSALASRINPEIHPLLQPRDRVAKVELLHFSADRGLCGSFNINILNKAEKWIKEHKAKGLEVGLTTIGRKGRDFFRKKGHALSGSHVNVYGAVDIAFSDQIAKAMINKFLTGEADEVYLMHYRFISMAKQEPTLVRLIPIEPMKEEKKAVGMTEYLIEPSAEELLIELLPKHISVQIFNAFLQQETSEYAARVAAMENATKNCSELVQSLTLAYNKARQAAITAELMDIVGGAEALR